MTVDKRQTARWYTNTSFLTPKDRRLHEFGHFPQTDGHGGNVAFRHAADRAQPYAYDACASDHHGGHERECRNSTVVDLGIWHGGSGRYSFVRLSYGALFYPAAFYRLRSAVCPRQPYCRLCAFVRIHPGRSYDSGSLHGHCHADGKQRYLAYLALLLALLLLLVPRFRAFLWTISDGALFSPL